MPTAKPTPAELCVTVTIPGVRVKTPGNTRAAWQVEYRRAKSERELAKAYVLALPAETLKRLRGAKRLRVTFVRLGGRKMDRTNLVGAFKHVQDGMCDALGKDDASDWYDWQWPTQEAGECGVRIELEAGE